MTTKEFAEKVAAVLQEKEQQTREWLAKDVDWHDVRHTVGFSRGLFCGLERMVYAMAPNDTAKTAALLLCAESDKRLEAMIGQHLDRTKRPENC